MTKYKNIAKDAVIVETDAAGTPVQRKDKTPNEESPTNVPKTSGAPEGEADTSKSPVANRNKGPRQAGVTPRPTDKPIVGGDRG